VVEVAEAGDEVERGMEGEGDVDAAGLSVGVVAVDWQRARTGAARRGSRGRCVRVEASRRRRAIVGGEGAAIAVGRTDRGCRCRRCAVVAVDKSAKDGLGVQGPGIVRRFDQIWYDLISIVI
jgi:hypothetical protein